MKTTIQITQEILKSYEQNVGQPGGVSRLMDHVANMNERVVKRQIDDPALKELVWHYTKHAAAAIRAMPPGTQTEPLIFTTLILAIEDWERINHEFNKQFTPAP